MKIKLYSNLSKEKLPHDLVTVKIAAAVPPYLAPETMVFADPDNSRVMRCRIGAAQYAADPGALPLLYGRALGQAGLFRINWQGAELSVGRAVDFVMSLYDGRHEICAALPVQEDDLREVQWRVDLLAKVREIAGGSPKEYTPVATVRALADLCAKAAEIMDPCTLTLRIVKRGDPEFERYAGLMAVGAGSLHEPCLGIIDFMPEDCDEDSPIAAALVGKGVTFDAGGYDLKSPQRMADMRTDKCGAVYCAGALAYAILEGLYSRVRCYLPCTENLVSASSLLPGDILTYPNGTTVEINNTDAEGRLILADSLLQAQEDGAEYIISAATLTDAVKTAVGRDMNAILSVNSELVSALCRKLFKTGAGCFGRWSQTEVLREDVWPLPLKPYHQRFLKSRRADLCNYSRGEGAPGASAAAAFLLNFIEDPQHWLHFDLSAAYSPEGSPFFAPGQATGCGVRFLAQTLLELTEHDEYWYMPKA